MPHPAGELRIIGGAWRGRRIRFRAGPGLRPTPDRLRETLFNWLGDWIVGRRVLDLYAGSGALGLEALSRGAAEAVFIERSKPVAAALRANLARLDARSARLERIEALAFLGATRETFDLVCVDPPWTSNLTEASLERLVAGALLASGHRVYVEQPVATSADLPAGWEVLRATRAGGAAGRLLRRAPPAGQNCPISSKT